MRCGVSGVLSGSVRTSPKLQGPPGYCSNYIGILVCFLVAPAAMVQRGN